MKPHECSQFSMNARAYKEAGLFAYGEDLQWMLQAATIVGKASLLDVGTGAGHTALAFAPYLNEVYGIDFTPQMIEQAKLLAQERLVQNVQFNIGDVCHLNFPDKSMDFVTCRFAAHHFSDIYTAMSQISRVLKPDGTFLLVDHIAPEENELDQFVNMIDKLRDPSHVREYTLSEWEQMYDQVHLSFEVYKKWDLQLNYPEWLKRAGVDQQTQQLLNTKFKQASDRCKEVFQINFTSDGEIESFCLKAALIKGIKQA